ncbi:glycosyltransferase family 39 protein [Candidatus Woesearchaeota archaeon]|nr:glycosyltransferase family 39 protein [Candidatus Woesearchaeota archaeon]
MKKPKTKQLIFITLILLLAFTIRFYNFNSEFQGFDPFVHYSVVEQALENNRLPVRNELDGCPDGIRTNHPIGFYFLPFILGRIINLKIAFALSSVISGVLTVFLVYILFRKIFNQKTALIGSLFLSVSFAHIVRSNAAYYRGENFILPFMILSLIFGLRFLTEKKKSVNCISASLFSALTVLFWPGYPYALVVYMLSVLLFIIYDFFKNREINKNIEFTLLSFTVQFILAYLLLLIFRIPDHGFIRYYLPFILVPGLIFLAIVRISNKYLKNIKYKILLVSLLIIAALAIVLIKKELFIQLLSGFGLLRPDISFYKGIIELQPITIAAIFGFFWIIPLFSLAGLIYMLFKLDSKRTFLLGAVIPSIYLLTTTLRFIFLASIIIIPLAAVLINAIKLDKRITYAIITLLLALAAAHAVSSLNNMSPAVHEDMIKAYDYFRENTDKESCLITIPDWGGMTQYYAKRPSYISSTNHNFPAFSRISRFLLSNESYDIDIDNSYFALMPDDFRKINVIIHITGVKGLYSDTLILEQKTKDNGLERNIYRTIDNKHYIAESSERGITVKRVEDSKETEIKNIFLEQNDRVFLLTDEDAEDNGCIYLSNYVTAYFNEKLCSTNMIKLLTKQEIDGLGYFYSLNNVRIYKKE